MKRSPCGVKRGSMNLQIGENGGYIGVPKENDRLNLDKVLEHFSGIKDSRDKYSENDRRGWSSVISEMDHQQRKLKEKRLDESLEHEILKIKQENEHTLKGGLSSPMRDVPKIVINDPHLMATNNLNRASIHFKGPHVPISAIATAEFGFGQEDNTKRILYKKDGDTTFSEEQAIDTTYKALPNPSNMSLVNI